MNPLLLLSLLVPIPSLLISYTVSFLTTNLVSLIRTNPYSRVLLFLPIPQYLLPLLVVVHLSLLEGVFVVSLGGMGLVIVVSHLPFSPHLDPFVRFVINLFT